MAGEIKRQVQRFPWATPAGGAVGKSAGLSAEEVKLNQGMEVQTPETAPIAQRGPVEFISPSKTSDHLRLAVPDAANPFATPTGPRHDHMMIRTAIARSNSDLSKSITVALRDPPKGIEKGRVDQMRAKVSREHAMLGLLHDLQQWREDVYARIAGFNRDV